MQNERKREENEQKKRKNVGSKQKSFKTKPFNRVFRSYGAPAFSFLVNRNNFENIPANNFCSIRAVPIWIENTVAFFNRPDITAFGIFLSFSGALLGFHIQLFRFFGKFLKKFKNTPNSETSVRQLDRDAQSGDIFATSLTNGTLIMFTQGPPQWE